MKRKIHWAQQTKRSRDEQLKQFDRRYGRTDYFDPKGRPIKMMRWVGLERFKRVNATWTKDHRHWISTVWLGLNHNWSPTQRPIIFETMVFCHHDDADGKRKRNAERLFATTATNIAELGDTYETHSCEIDNEMDRYATISQARKGHWKMVERVRHYEALADAVDSVTSEVVNDSQ